jgi:hypothetical protein
MTNVKNFKGANNTIMVKDAHGKIVDNIAGAPRPVETVTVAIPDRFGELKGVERTKAAEESLLASIEEMRTSEEFMAALAFSAKLHKYSVWNGFMLHSEHLRRIELDPSTPADPGVFQSFNGWKNVDRSVMKGAKGYPIFAPNFASGRYYLDGGRKVFLKKGQPAPGGREVFEGKDILVGFSVATTFPAYLTSGAPIPERPAPRLLEGGAVKNLTDVLTTFAYMTGFTVEYVPAKDLNGANGSTSPTEKKIRVRDDVSPLQAQKTLIHEVAHAILHSDKDYDYHGCRGEAEVEAESTAYMVAKMLGADTSDYSVPYVAGWSEGMSMSEVRTKINGIGKAAKSIVDAFEAHTEVVPAS